MVASPSPSTRWWRDGGISGGYFPGGGGGGGGTGRWAAGAVAMGVTAMAAAGIAFAAILAVSVSSSASSSPPSPPRGSLKSPWSRRKRKRALSRRQWCSLFTLSGRLRDGGAKFLKRVRSAGVDPSIRSEVWPFLLGVYDLNSTESDRNVGRMKKRKEYKKLRQLGQKLLDQIKRGDPLGSFSDIIEERSSYWEDMGSSFSQVDCARDSVSTEEVRPRESIMSSPVTVASRLCIEVEDKNEITCVDPDDAVDTGSSDSEFSDEEPQSTSMSTIMEESTELEAELSRSASVKEGTPKCGRTSEDFATWQRIIRLDAMRVDHEWVLYSPRQAAVSQEKAFQLADSVGLKDYDHLEPCIIYHAARLVAVLEAYAIYDPEIGYCQGMSDLLSPLVAVMEEDDEAFWCFAAFMRKARHNFRLDEIGIRRQLKIVSRIIKYRDSHLYKHLEKMQAEDCFFVYRMVLVLFRRELTFEQTLCLWEVMWADQAAIRAGFGRSIWGKIRLRAPPTDDLLLYAVAACILQRRKLIIQKYNSMDEILRECNSMTGQLDVWRLLDDAHTLVMNLHDKV